MSSLVRSANMFVHTHAPFAVRLMREYRTAKYRRAVSQPSTVERFIACAEDMATSEREAGLGTFTKPTRLISSPVVEINNTCNIDCLMCKTSLATRKKGKMADEMLKHILGRFGEMEIIGVELHTIGDPLANPNLRAVMTELRKNGLTTAITTNALLLHRHHKTLLEFRDVCRGMTVSIDGATPATYERIRFGGKWADLMRNVEIARTELKGKIPLRTNTVVSRDNLSEMGLLIETFRDFVDEPSRDMTFGFIGALSPDTTYFDAVNLMPRHTKKNVGCRFVSGTSLFAHIDGRASVCCRDYDGSLVIGDLKTQTVREIWESAPLASLQKAHESGDLKAFPLCDNCHTVDPRIDVAFKLMTKMLLHHNPRQTAGFYQQAIDQFVETFSANPVDPRRARELVSYIRAS